jgi:hypothetical protein
MIDAYIGTVQYIDQNRVLVIGDDRTIHSVNLPSNALFFNTQSRSTGLKAGDHIWLACTNDAGLERAIVGEIGPDFTSSSPMWKALTTIGGDASTGSNRQEHRGRLSVTSPSKLSRIAPLLERLGQSRQAAGTNFQGVDQKTTQLMNILATVLKTMEEETGTINRNLG